MGEKKSKQGLARSDNSKINPPSKVAKFSMVLIACFKIKILVP